jgi:DnaJ-class molecular chaperone
MRFPAQRIIMDLDAAMSAMGLGVLPLDAGAVQRAYTVAALRAHPDKGGSADEFVLLGAAKETLLTAIKHRVLRRALRDGTDVVTVGLEHVLRGSSGWFTASGNKACDACEGVGARSIVDVVSCMACRGAEVPCDACGGRRVLVKEGRGCQACGGRGSVAEQRRLWLELPAGVEDGDEVVNDGGRVVVRWAEGFEVDARGRVVVRVPLSLADFLCGATVKFTTFHGRRVLKTEGAFDMRDVEMDGFGIAGLGTLVVRPELRVERTDVDALMPFGSVLRRMFGRSTTAAVDVAAPREEDHERDDDRREDDQHQEDQRAPSFAR